MSRPPTDPVLIDRAYRPSPDVIAQRLGDSVVLVHMQTDKIFELNRTGARLWELVSAGKSCAQARRQMLQEFDVDEGQLATETEAIMSSFLTEKLLSAEDAK